MPVIKVETIANSKLALAQSSIKPNPQKQIDIEIKAYFWMKNMAHATSIPTVDPTIEERETNLLFLSVIPNAKKLIMREAQLVNNANPA